MIPKWAYLTASALLAFCLGCVATSTMPQQKINLFTTKTFSAPSDRELEVSTGDTIFMQGIYMEGESNAFLVKDELRALIQKEVAQ